MEVEALHINKDKVFMKDEKEVYRKIRALSENGSEQLQIISDFDMTLSRFSYNGKRCSSCHGVLESDSVIPKETQLELQKLKTKYYAIEIDHVLTREEKIPYMIEWWSLAHKIFENAKIHKSYIRDAVANSSAMLKVNCDKFFSTLNKHSIPLLLFSAGVGDILEEIIRQKSTFYPNMKTVSNFMAFDKDGFMTGYKNDLIHTFNKNEKALANSDYFETIKHRHNIMLLGDSMGDLHMADGIQNISNCLKIGYLNDKVDDLLDYYMDSYDIVLVDDPTLNIANAILAKIC